MKKKIAPISTTPVFIPPISSSLTLAQPWQFTIYHESRNDKFISTLRSCAVLPPIPDEPERYTAEYSAWCGRQEAFYAANRSGLSWNARFEEVSPPTRYTPEWEAWNTARRNIEGHYGEPVCKLTLPEDTVLKVARIYIRCGKGEYDSITFNANFKALLNGKEKKITGRFWARLSEVNKMVVKTIEAGKMPNAPDIDQTVDITGAAPVPVIVPEVVLARKFNFE